MEKLGRVFFSLKSNFRRSNAFVKNSMRRGKTRHAKYDLNLPSINKRSEDSEPEPDHTISPIHGDSPIQYVTSVRVHSVPFISPSPSFYFLPLSLFSLPPPPPPLLSL